MVSVNGGKARLTLTVCHGSSAGRSLKGDWHMAVKG